MGAVALAQFTDFFWPRGVAGFGGKVTAGKVADFPPGGEPKHNNEGRFWMVHITPQKGGEGQYQGLLALWHKCPHLGCTVPWRADFAFQGTTGWFRCPCHGSTYTYAGVRVFGPAPRSMDTMEITVDASGNIVVNTGNIKPGGTTAMDNPSRAVKV
jgi:cytochrome b6-f complex iron-sulfur subunit